MNNLFWGTLAAAVGIYMEKKYKVSDKIVKWVSRYAGKTVILNTGDLFSLQKIENLINGLKFIKSAFYSVM